MRATILLGCVLIIAACTGPTAQNQPTPGRTSLDPEPASGVTLSGYARFGYSKGG
ncbi:hypothetical protein [uncultured Roseobacter sp.]|uniref:hypothetical protein n=1 Tax=uncultured Roseobacter sp. TaxID=114847 RepID=UPI0026174AF2|nr:hypothetical protein [uncultured Roseobacter sp.]